MDVKADHRAAGLSIHLNFLDVQGVDGEDIAVGFALRRRRAAVACLTKIGAGLNGLFLQLRLTGTASDAIFPDSIKEKMAEILKR